MSKEKIFKMIYDASVLIGISSGFGYFVNLYDPSDSVIDYLKWVGILSGSIYLKDYSTESATWNFVHVQREEILKRIDSLNSKKGSIESKEKKVKAKNLDLKLKRIVNLANPVGDRDAVNKSYVDEKVIRKGDLDMGGDSIHNLKTPETKDATFAASVNYVNKTVSNSNSVLQTQWQDHVSERFDYAVDKEMENDFKYALEGNRGNELVDELNIKGMGVITSKDFHPINKRTVHFDLEFKKDHFKSSFAVNLRYAPKSYKYTVVCEMFWDDSVTSSIELATLKASSLNTSEVIFAQQSNVFENHVRTLVRTQRIFSWNPDKLVFDIVIKYRSGVAYPQKLPVYIVFYGSKGFFNNIPTSVWNSWRVFDQGNVSMQKNLILYQDPTVDKGAATKKYVDDNITSMMKKIFYKGYLLHNNENVVKFYANGTSDHTKYVRQSDPSDFIVNAVNEEVILIKNPGVYSISLIDGLKTGPQDDNGTVQFILNPAPFLSLSDNINITVPNTSKGWKTYNFISVLDIYKDTALKIQTTDVSTIFDGMGTGNKKYGMILINKID